MAGIMRVCDSCAQDLSQEPWAGVVNAAREVLDALILHDTGNRREAINWLVEECSRGASSVRSLDEKMRIVLCLLQDEGQSCKRDGGGGIRASALEAKRRAAEQFLTLVCEQRPELVAPFFTSDAPLLRSFFRGDARRVELWFDHFHRAGPKQGAPPAAAGKSPTLGGPGPCPSEEERAGGAQGLEGHKFGARALARFVFRQREEHWGLLCWRGRHAHSPVSVVARPHYLADLDVARTVEALLREAPDFWDSPELRAELRDGSFLAIDLPFFVGRLERALHEERVEQGKGAGVRSSSAHGMSAVSLVREFLRASNFSESLRWVLPVASDKGLLGAANAVAGALSRRSPHRSSSSSRGSGAAWEGEQGLDARPAQVRRLWESTVSVLELGQGMPWPSLDALLLCCACVPGARQVLRLLRDPEWGHLRAQAQESTQGLRLLLLGSARPSPSSPAAPLPTPTERGGGGSRVARMSTEAAACVCLASFATRLALLPPAFGEDGERRGRVDEATGAWYSSLDRLLAREGIEARREGGGAAAGDSYKLVSDGEEADRPERGAGKRKRRDREGKGSRARRQRRRSEEPEARGVARGGRGSSHSPPPSQSTAAETPSWWRLALDGFEATWEAKGLGDSDAAERP